MRLHELRSLIDRKRAALTGLSARLRRSPTVGWILFIASIGMAATWFWSCGRSAVEYVAPSPQLGLTIRSFPIQLTSITDDRVMLEQITARRRHLVTLTNGSRLNVADVAIKIQFPEAILQVHCTTHSLNDPCSKVPSWWQPTLMCSGIVRSNETLEVNISSNYTGVWSIRTPSIPAHSAVTFELLSSLEENAKTYATSGRVFDGHKPPILIWSLTASYNLGPAATRKERTWEIHYNRSSRSVNSVQSLNKEARDDLAQLVHARPFAWSGVFTSAGFLAAYSGSRYIGAFDFVPYTPLKWELAYRNGAHLLLIETEPDYANKRYHFTPNTTWLSKKTRWVGLVDDDMYTEQMNSIGRLRDQAESGDLDAQANLGTYYSFGVGGQMDAAEGLRWTTMAAERGQAGAQHNLGNIYFDGEGVDQDHEKAFQWFRRAAEQGLAEAQLRLGIMYLMGSGVPSDAQQAEQWFQTAAERGFSDAQYRLGMFYKSGLGIPIDRLKSLRWLMLAAQQGHAEAAMEVGVIYADGTTVTRDFSEAAKWLSIAQEKGSPAASYCLGEMHLGGDGFPQDPGQACKIFQLAANAGFPLAQYRLSWCYSLGVGVEPNPQQALRWLKTASDNQLPAAQTTLAIRYASGDGVPQDYEQSLDLLRQAASSGDATAQFELGRAYAEGRGIEADDVHANDYFRQAADQGHSRAQYTLGGRYLRGIGAPAQPDEGFRLIKTAAELGLPEAQGVLVICYAQGIGVPHDPNEAYFWHLVYSRHGKQHQMDVVQRILDSVVSHVSESIRSELRLRADKWKPIEQHK